MEDEESRVLHSEEGIIDGYRVIYDQMPRNWSAYSPDLLGCVSVGDTREEVEANMREAIAFHLEGLAEDRAERPWLYGEASHA